MQSNADSPIDPAPKPSLAGSLQSTKVPLWVCLLLAVALIGVGGWSMVAKSATERRSEDERLLLSKKLEADLTSARLQMETTISSQTRELQGLFGTALAWAVRSSMLRNNLDEIDQYFIDLVKNPRIALVLLADADGKVLRSTDRKYIDATFSGHFPAVLLQDADVSVHVGNSNLVRLVLPIQGLTSRLGTVLVEYTSPS
jgi:hypothetical protein